MIESGLAVAIIIAISQVVKDQGLKTKFIPLFNLALGLIAGVFFMQDLTLQESIIQGLIIGLTASGLFDQSKVFKGGE